MTESAPVDAAEAQLDQQIAAIGTLLNRDPSAAFLQAEEAMRNAEVAGYPHAYARALRARAMCYGAMGNLHAARDGFRASLEQARQMEDLRLQAQCLHGLGNVCFYLGEFAQALEYMHSSVALYRDIGNESELLIALNSLGAAFTQLSDYSNAVVHFTDSLQIARRLGDKTNEALALCNIGNAKLEFGQIQQAIARLTESLRLIHEASAPIYKPFALTNLATAYYRANQLEAALSVGTEAVEICRALGNQPLEVGTLYVLGMVHQHRGEIETAEVLFLKAFHLATTVTADLQLVDIACALGRLYIGKGEFDAAKEYLEAGLRAVKPGQQKLHLSELHLALSELYEAMGDSVAALAAYRAYHALYRTELKESAQQQLTAQLALLEIDRAQKQAEIHRLRNIELAEANRRNIELLERLQHHANQLAELVITDPLTGMYNRRYLQDYLQEEFENTQRLPYLSIAIVDLDNFKKVNDRFSHRIGDEVLKATSKLLQSTIRRSDTAVRFGGEEFVIVFPMLMRTDAREVSERVRQAIASYPWSDIHPELNVTTSIGISDTEEEIPNHADLTTILDRVFALADERLYRAKEHGKNRVVST